VSTWQLPSSTFSSLPPSPSPPSHSTRIRLNWAVSIAMFALLFDIGFALVWASSGQTTEDAIRLITRLAGVANSRQSDCPQTGDLIRLQ
jgi:hypothetical protein